MVDMVVAGNSSERAAQVIWNNTTTGGEPIGNDFAVADSLGGQAANSATGETPEEDEEYVSVTAAFVDDDCQIHVGSEHEGDCYPEIALESTIEHEGIHVLQCEAPQPIGGLNGQADREVEAYAHETEFWRNWIPENCG